jgi:hypothetical protein
MYIHLHRHSMAGIVTGVGRRHQPMSPCHQQSRVSPRETGATSNMPIPCGILHQCQASSMAPSTRRHPRQRSRGQHPLYRWYVGTTPTVIDDKSAFTLLQGARHPSTMSIHDILQQHWGQYYALLHDGGGILYCYHFRRHTSLCLTRRGTGYHKPRIDGRSDILFT